MPSLMTLMKSNTTRRSQPMIRSRLRRPTSKSMTTVFLPRSARPVAMAAAEVVLPTPPLPDVTTITLAKFPSSCRSSWPPVQGSSQVSDHQPLVLELDAGTSTLVLRVDLLRHQVHPGDRQELGLELVAEDQGGLVTFDAGKGPAPQGAVDVDVARGRELGPDADRCGDDEIAGHDDLLATTDRLGDYPRGSTLGRRCHRRRCYHGWGAAGTRRGLDRAA